MTTDAFTASVQIMTVCWIFTPCSVLRLLRRFERTYCLYLCVTELGKGNFYVADRSFHPVTSPSTRIKSVTLKMEAVRSSETSKHTKHNTRCEIPETG